jgi:hypothetical protein
VILATALTGALALGLAGPSAWQPAHPGRQPRRAFGEGTIIPPRAVIIQARARQRRRRRNVAMTAAAAGAAITGRSAGLGSPPPHRHRSRHHHGDPASPPLPSPRAERLPGLPAHIEPVIGGLSCPSAGNCALDGTYFARLWGGASRMFVANEIHGRWDNAKTIAGIPARSAITADSVSCPSAGNCLTAGYYHARRKGVIKSFIVAERNGIWGSAQHVRGLTSGSKGSFGVDAVSCASPGNCAIGGSSAGGPLAVSETNGQWGKAQPIRGLPSPPGSPLWSSSISGISCTSAGNCTAAGTYPQVLPDHTRVLGVFVVSENEGAWGRAELLRGTLIHPTNFMNVQVSCAAASSCGLIASPELITWRFPSAGFVASKIHGIWGNAEPVPGIKGGYTIMGGLSCPAPGHCAADGYNGHRNCTYSFTVTQTHGIWHDAQEIPGTHCSKESDWFGTLSCASAGDCLAGATGWHAATATETHGRWHDAREVPGVATLNRPVGSQSEIDAISCPPGGPCTSAGKYRFTFAPTAQVFVIR